MVGWLQGTALGSAGDDVRQRSPALHHTHPSTSLTPPEAQHSGTQPGAFTQTNSAEGGDSTSDKLPGKSILTTV